MDQRGRSWIARMLGGAAAATLAAALVLAAAAAPAGAWPSVVLRLRAAPLETGPITYFNTACAACHGDYGSFYGQGFAADLDDAKLRRVVREMVEGPAQGSLGARDLAALTAYHRSLADGAPFVAWTGVRDGVLTGEVTPGSVVTVAFDGGATAAAEVHGHSWRARPIRGAAWMEIRAERAGRATVLKRGGGFSHPAPAGGGER